MTLKNDWVDGPTDPVTAVHMNAVANTVNGLVTATSNVDNTHDSAKPVSTAQAAAIATKLNGEVLNSSGTAQPSKVVHVKLDAFGDIDDITIT